MNSTFFVFDVESVGLHGEPYAVGWTVVNRHGNECEGRALPPSGRLSIPPELVHGADDDRDWISKNVPPIPATHTTLESMLRDFWDAWMAWKKEGALMFAECAWPVEAKFLAMCIGVNYPDSKWDGPYPLHDVASVMFAKEMDPMISYPRVANELPTHDPLADARQSARLLVMALFK